MLERGSFYRQAIRLHHASQNLLPISKPYHIRQTTSLKGTEKELARDKADVVVSSHPIRPPVVSQTNTCRAICLDE